MGNSFCGLQTSLKLVTKTVHVKLFSLEPIDESSVPHSTEFKYMTLKCQCTFVVTWFALSRKLGTLASHKIGERRSRNTSATSWLLESHDSQEVCVCVSVCVSVLAFCIYMCVYFVLSTSWLLESHDSQEGGMPRCQRSEDYAELIAEHGAHHQIRRQGR